MTEKEANERLIEREEFYFNLDNVSHTNYAAVIKKSTDYKNTKDYIIEVGISNTNIFIDKLRKNFSDPSILEEYDKKEIKIVASNRVKLQTKRLDKITGGCSVFFEKGDLSSGTAGAFFRTKENDKNYMISNRHVIVDNNENLNTLVVHPAPIESIPKNSEKIIGKVSWSSNKDDEFMDAAIAEIDYPVDIGKYSISPEIKILGIAEPKIGQNVRKYGNTSKMTYGEIRSVNCTVNVSGTINYKRFFRNQILTTLMTRDGDSGSALVTDDDKIVGLLFAGDDFSTSYANNIKYIFNHSTEKFKEKNISKFV